MNDLSSTLPSALRASGGTAQQAHRRGQWCAVVIGQALRSAGIAHSCHALRHTLACRIVNSGSSIKEVADVLRHRSLNTSLIYAKLDLQLLAEVALPWPGSAA
jgi:site-specific recombinase XerD